MGWKTMQNKQIAENNKTTRTQAIEKGTKHLGDRVNTEFDVCGCPSPWDKLSGTNKQTKGNFRSVVVSSGRWPTGKTQCAAAVL
jgi:hypothetical protein